MTRPIIRGFKKAQKKKNKRSNPKIPLKTNDTRERTYLISKKGKKEKGTKEKNQSERNRLGPTSNGKGGPNGPSIKLKSTTRSNVGQNDSENVNDERPREKGRNRTGVKEDGADKKDLIDNTRKEAVGKDRTGGRVPNHP